MISFSAPTKIRKFNWNQCSQNWLHRFCNNVLFQSVIILCNSPFSYEMISKIKYANDHNVPLKLESKGLIMLLHWNADFCSKLHPILLFLIFQMLKFFVGRLTICHENKTISLSIHCNLFCACQHYKWNWGEKNIRNILIYSLTYT